MSLHKQSVLNRTADCFGYIYLLQSSIVKLFAVRYCAGKKPKVQKLIGQLYFMNATVQCTSLDATSGLKKKKKRQKRKKKSCGWGKP